jgi:DNA polymerase-1
MQNLPASGEIGKLVKSCFSAPEGWLFGGADFASLEDYVSALTTQDPNKLKVYLDGYDGHCLRAFSYFKEHMPDIVDTVESINSIAELYPQWRKLSKTPTFLLTYDGTYHGLMGSLGLEESVAKAIDNNYHTLYAHSDKWKRKKIEQASIDGYVTVAFGLRVRTPILARTILNTSSTPYEAKAEVRKAGNALGQSYGLLNCRAANEFFRRVRNSPFVNDIKIACQIHDAIYLMWRDVMEITEWVNRNLTECMAWQDLPELEHDKVKLHAELDVFAPHWANGIKLLPEDDMETIFDKCVDGYNSYMSKQAA